MSKIITHSIHEWGHCKTGSTHKVNSPFELVLKNEEKANRCAIKEFLPFETIQHAVQNGITEFWELAEYFNVEEEFIRKAIEYYTQACGKTFYSNIENF